MWTSGRSGIRAHPDEGRNGEKIADALLRLEEGTYGLCFECGEEIAQPRLRALPLRSAARIAKKPSRWHRSEIGAVAPGVIGPRLRDARLNASDAIGAAFDGSPV